MTNSVSILYNRSRGWKDDEEIEFTRQAIETNFGWSRFDLSGILKGRSRDEIRSKCQNLSICYSSPRYMAIALESGRHILKCGDEYHVMMMGAMFGQHKPLHVATRSTKEAATNAARDMIIKYCLMKTKEDMLLLAQASEKMERRLEARMRK